MPETIERRKRVCVVGAGAAGLPAVRHSLLYGFETVCYEGGGGVGGLWRYKPDETDESSVMKSTVINSSKEMSAYSDFPPKPEDANFMHNRVMHQYFADYAEHYELNRHIKLYHMVQNIERAEDYEETGRWNITVTDTKTRKTITETFDGVLFATGHHKFPYWPEPWPGQEHFKGKMIHSHSYKDHKGYEDKTVVVVGIGNSGGDIATELSKLAKQVYLVKRTGVWLFGRCYEYGRPLDCCLDTRFFNWLKETFPTFVDGFLRWAMNRRIDHELYGLKPDHGVFGNHLAINDELPNRLASGTIRLKPLISRFTENNGIEFVDGTNVDNVDAVIVATGYTIHFPELEKGQLVKVEDNVVDDLFQFIFPLNLEHDTLGLIGLIQPFGSIAPISELQSRVVLDVIAGRSKLPSREERIAINKKKLEENEKRYAKSRRHTIQVDHLPYMDELASYIGCSPPSWISYFPSDPIMCLYTLFAPFAPYFYRIKGPHAWDGAREAILTIEDRIAKGNNPQQTNTLSSTRHVGLYETAFGVVGFVIACAIFAVVAITFHSFLG